MPNKRSRFALCKRIGAVGSFTLTISLIAAFNFIEIFYRTYKLANASGTYDTTDGAEITVCYFGPPVGFFPRLLVFISLFIACVGIFKNGLRGRIVSLIGVAGALSAYVYWWIASYATFKSFSSFEMDFLNNPEITQVAYLYEGSLVDVCVAVSLIVILSLQAERAFTEKTRLS